MMKKEWLNPEVKELNLDGTQEDICYCEAGEALAAQQANQDITAYKHHGCGHPHKPWQPCPPNPCPPPSQNS